MDRLTVREAAQRLNISEGAVRMRLHRGTLEGEQDDNGRTYVLLVRDNSETTSETTGSAPSELVEELRARVSSLEHQLQLREEESRRKDHLLAAALERIPALEAPSEPQGAPETVSEEGSRGTGRAEEERPQRRSWWRRFFGVE